MGARTERKLLRHLIKLNIKRHLTVAFCLLIFNYFILRWVLRVENLVFF
jgi:hypothetical protein